MRPLPALSGAAWLAEERVTKIFALLNRDGDHGRVVGGAIRDSLQSRPVADVDFATTAVPKTLIERAEAVGIKAVPTGIEHGTVTLVVDGRGHEVTTLREDIETDGRHAVVRFGRDWLADAQRRDFTMNALSVDPDGTLHDPVGGYEDVLAGRVRFIGDPQTRIAEDRLRILRFFRFHAQCGVGDLDRDGLRAAIVGRLGILDLAAERINTELRKLLLAEGALDTVTAMQEAGILPIVLSGIGYPARFGRVLEFERCAGLKASYPRRLAGLATVTSEDAERVSTKLRLANADRDAITVSIHVCDRWRDPPSPRELRSDIYRFGREAVTNGLALAAASGSEPVKDWADVLESAREWDPPAFPITGRDLTAEGVAAGPAMGELLRRLEEWWTENDFKLGHDELLRRLREITGDER